LDVDVDVGLVVAILRGFSVRVELRLVCGGVVERCEVVRVGRGFFEVVSAEGRGLFPFLLCAGVGVARQRQIIETKIIRENLYIFLVKLLFVIFSSIRVKVFNYSK
jgi:hypothetical protein